MSYIVAYFINEQVFNEVPEKWKDTDDEDNLTCWYPKDSMKALKLIQHPEEEDPNAENYSIHAIEWDGKTYANWENARKRALDVNYTSDENKKGRGKRQKFKRLFSQESSSDELTSDTETAEQMKNKPPLKKGNRKKSKETEGGNQNLTKVPSLLPQLPSISSKMQISVGSNTEKVPLKNTAMSTAPLNLTEDSGTFEKAVVDYSATGYDSEQELEQQSNCQDQLHTISPKVPQNRSPLHDEHDWLSSASTIQTGRNKAANLQKQRMTINCPNISETPSIVPLTDNERNYLGENSNLNYLRNNGIDLHQSASLVMCGKLKGDLRSVNRRLTNLEKNEQAQKENEILPKYLPLKDIADILRWDEELKRNNRAKIEFENKIRKVGGDNKNEHIERVLKAVFSPECAAKCTWLGKGRNNYGIHDSKTIQIMKDRFCLEYSSLSEKNFENTASQWFRLAKQRLVRKESKERAEKTDAASKKTPSSKVDHSLKKIILPESAIFNFLAKAARNSKHEIETCAFLCGKKERNCYKVSHVLIPQQMGTENSCTATNEEKISELQEENDLLTLGWIHTHPTQSSFMSSVDLHTQLGHQLQLPEAIAVVCSLQMNETDVFHLTKDGIRTIKYCKQSGFHDHAAANTSIYVKAKHYVLDKDTYTVIIDTRDDEQE